MDDTRLRTEKWVVLGDMLELGEDEQAYHESIADQIVTMNLEGILFIGPRMKWLYDELQKRGIKTKLIWSEDDYEPITELYSVNIQTRTRSSC